jgi:excisionase family DNA binding protein
MVEQLERLFRVPEAAEYLRAHPATVYRWVRQGRLPARLVGNYYVFTERQLTDFLEPVTPSHPK